MKQNEEELKTCFEYELSRHNRSLFSEEGMQKIKKSDLYDYIECKNELNKTYVVNEGFRLHRVIWQINQTLEHICNLYKFYIKKHFATN